MRGEGRRNIFSVENEKNVCVSLRKLPTPNFGGEIMESKTGSHVLKFSQPYIFSGQSYTEIDLSGIEHMTASDMSAAERYMIGEWIFTPEVEDALEYNFFLASRFSGLPMQFFMQLRPKDAGRLKAMITEFINGDAAEGGNERDVKNE